MDLIYRLHKRACDLPVILAVKSKQKALSDFRSVFAFVFVTTRSGMAMFIYDL